MTYKAARLQIGKAMRARAVEELEREIERLRERSAEYVMMESEQCADRFFPFRAMVEPDGSLEVGVGRATWTCEEAAREVARLTGKPVSYVFNGRAVTVSPGEAA